MAKDSKIQWTDATWNPWHGCIKVSPGCKFCYMYRDKERYNQDPTTVIRSSTKFKEPLVWAGNNKAKVSTLPFGSKIFTCSWSDFFIEEADEWRDEAWDIIKKTPQYNYQILTKRPERIMDCLPKDWGRGYLNVWIGVSVESQDQMERVRLLQNIPAHIRFISAEPLIGPISFNYLIAGIDWVIIGGESGNKNGKYRFRECRELWITQIIDACELYNIPVFVKQLGTHLSSEYGMKDRHGGDMDEWPLKFCRREFPRLPGSTESDI